MPMRPRERYHFSQLPLTVSGNVPVAYVSGHIDWRLNANRSVSHVYELYLHGPNGALIEVDMQDDPITAPVVAALKKVLQAGFPESDPVPVGDPAELPEKLRPTVDSNDPQGAQQTTD